MHCRLIQQFLRRSVYGCIFQGSAATNVKSEIQLHVCGQIIFVFNSERIIKIGQYMRKLCSNENFFDSQCTGCFRKKVAPLKLFGIFFTSVKSFCVKFCKFVGSSYPHISTIFCRFIIILHQIALIFLRVLIIFILSSFE